MQLEIRLYNSLQRFAPNGSACFPIDIEPGATLADLVAILGIPRESVFVAIRNGGDPELMADNRFAAVPVQEGDAVTLSGPIPFSRGYGAPVV